MLTSASTPAATKGASVENSTILSKNKSKLQYHSLPLTNKHRKFYYHIITFHYNSPLYSLIKFYFFSDDCDKAATKPSQDGLVASGAYLKVQCLLQSMEVELLWRRPNAPSVALRGGLSLLRLAEFVRYNRAAIGGPSKRQPIKLPRLNANPQSYQIDV